MTDFAALLLRSLPGIYRQKDETGDLSRFLEIVAAPLAETEASIGQLYDDLFGASARSDFLPLIGGLIGADIDPTLPASLQRAALADTLAFYRSKGLAASLASTVQAFTGWQTVAVDYSQVVARTPFIDAPSGELHAGTLDLRDSHRLTRIGRSDDPAPYTLDLRAPARTTDRIGRAHFDNHGLFLTVGRRVDNRRPNRLLDAPLAGFSFDDRPIAIGDTAGNQLQLQDGIDGAPITIGSATQVGRFVDHEADFVDTARGFTIRARGVSLIDPAFGGRVVAANLADLANPKDPHDPSGGTGLTLAARDIAVDPQRGRFLLRLETFGITADDLRVSYLLASATRVTDGTPAPIGPDGSNTWAFAVDGRTTPLRDALDGTPLRTKIRLGARLFDDYAGRARGFRVFVGASDITANGSLNIEEAAIEGPGPAPEDHLLIDVERGRFALPPSLPAGELVRVEFSAADAAAEARVFASLAQRLPGLVPAGVVPVVVDTRTPTIDLSNFVLAAKAHTL